MKFKMVTLSTVLILAISTSVTILFALHLKNIWALVIGNISGSITAVLLSFLIFSGPSMRICFDTDSLKIIISRGKWIVGHSALTVVMGVADRFVLGFAMSASSFGFYYIARQVVDLIEGFLSTVHAQMGLQVFTEFQKKSSPIDVRIQYYRYRIIFDILAFFGAGVLFTFSPTLIGIIYDDRYFNVAEIIQILALSLLLTGPGLLREAYSAQRRFRAMTLLSVVRAATIWAGLVVAVIGFGSVIGALFVISLHRIPETVILLLMGRRDDWIDLWREVRLLPLVPLGAGIGLGLEEIWQIVSA